jgi:hypothetical protein
VALRLVTDRIAAIRIRGVRELRNIPDKETRQGAALIFRDLLRAFDAAKRSGHLETVITATVDLVHHFDYIMARARPRIPGIAKANKLRSKASVEEYDAALVKHGGNVTLAAAELDVYRQTITARVPLKRRQQIRKAAKSGKPNGPSTKKVSRR